MGWPGCRGGARKRLQLCKLICLWVFLLGQQAGAQIPKACQGLLCALVLRSLQGGLLQIRQEKKKNGFGSCTDLIRVNREFGIWQIRPRQQSGIANVVWPPAHALRLVLLRHCLRYRNQHRLLYMRLIHNNVRLYRRSFECSCHVASAFSTRHGHYNRKHSKSMAAPVPVPAWCPCPVEEAAAASPPGTDPKHKGGCSISRHSIELRASAQACCLPLIQGRPT